MSARCMTMAPGGTRKCTIHRVPPQPNTVRLLRANRFVQSPLARSRRRQLISLSKYPMRQRVAAVNQSPFPLVFNTADNALI